MPFKLPVQPEARKQVLAALLKLKRMSPTARGRLLEQIKGRAPAKKLQKA